MGTGLPFSLSPFSLSVEYEMARPIDKYRIVNTRIRRILDPYTAKVCPVCPDPCCRKPTKVREFDVLLANACGCSLPSANYLVADMVQAGIDSITGSPRDNTDLEPCDYLGPKGCVFPSDLRPFECTRWTCIFLKDVMSPGDMRGLRDLLHKLGTLHREIQDTVIPKKR